MKPYLSEEDRSAIVKHFIYLRGQGKAPIADFEPLTRYLNDKSIKFLHNLEHSGISRQTYHDGIQFKTQVYTYYNGKDAEEYFNWLISILTGATEATDEIRKEACEQMFMFIFALRDKMTINIDTLLKVSFQWEDMFNSLNRDFVDFQRNMDVRNEKIMDILEKINNWQKTYKPYLKRLKDEQDNLGNVLPKKGKLKNEKKRID